jgi:hypothetical protein
LSGTPSQAGTFSFTVTAPDSAGCTGRRAYSLTINCAPITATVSGGGAICPGGSATVTVTLNGGTAPYTVTLTNGGGTQTGSSSTFNFTLSPASATAYAVQSATDAYGCPATASGSATVTGDSVQPALTLKPDLSLWPPDHNYRTVTMSQMVQSVSDNCSSLSLNNVVIEKVTSDEPDDIRGASDGATTGDIVIAANCKSVQLRAERDGAKNGRVYVVTLRLKDASGNATRKDFKVSVPMNQSGAPAVQGVAAQTKMSSCP